MQKVGPAAVCRIHCSRKKTGALAQVRGSKSRKTETVKQASRLPGGGQRNGWEKSRTALRESTVGLKPTPMYAFHVDTLPDPKVWGLGQEGCLTSQW